MYVPAAGVALTNLMQHDGMTASCSFSTKSRSGETMSGECASWYEHAADRLPRKTELCGTGAVAQKQSLSEERKRYVELRHVQAPSSQANVSLLERSRPAGAPFRRKGRS